MKRSSGFQFYFKAQTISSLSRLLLRGAHTVSAVLMDRILSGIPQLLSFYFPLPSPRFSSAFVSQPPSVQIYLSPLAADSPGVFWNFFFFLLFIENVLWVFVDIMWALDSLSARLSPRGVEASQWHGVWLMQRLCARAACSLMRWLMECHSGAGADPTSRWTGFCNLAAVPPPGFPGGDCLLSRLHGNLTEMLFGGWASLQSKDED